MPESTHLKAPEMTDDSSHSDGRALFAAQALLPGGWAQDTPAPRQGPRDLVTEKD